MHTTPGPLHEATYGTLQPGNRTPIHLRPFCILSCCCIRHVWSMISIPHLRTPLPRPRMAPARPESSASFRILGQALQVRQEGNIEAVALYG